MTLFYAAEIAYRCFKWVNYFLLEKISVFIISHKSDFTAECRVEDNFMEGMLYTSKLHSLLFPLSNITLRWYTSQEALIFRSESAKVKACEEYDLES